MSHFISSIFFITFYGFLLLHAQENRFGAGINIFGAVSNSLDLQLEYNLNDHMLLTISGGFQEKARASETYNSKSTKASGKFIRGGAIFMSGNTDDRIRLFARVDLVVFELRHQTIVSVQDYYDQIEVPFTPSPEREFGGSFGIGWKVNFNRLFNLDIAFIPGFTQLLPAYVNNSYPVPGLGYGFAFSTRPFMYVRPILGLTYKFNSKSKTSGSESPPEQTSPAQNEE
jgi:lipoprotein signal peptidase